ncbi:hypothetical protein SAMN05518670_2296 [Paenibacillus sp. OK076]|nr:hypothetical protein SAMN05518670_2296 [Paenibacillus sp. OK076]
MVPSLNKVYVATIYIVQLTNNNYQTRFTINYGDLQLMRD